MAAPRPPFEIETRLDGADIHLERRDFQSTSPISATLTTVLFAVGVVSAMLGSIGIAIACILTALLIQAIRIGIAATNRRSSERTTIVINGSGIEVDGVRFALDAEMTLHHERIVFRDEDHRIDIWHRVRNLDDRMRLRDLFETALRSANQRLGHGPEEVPDSLKRLEEPR